MILKSIHRTAALKICPNRLQNSIDKFQSKTFRYRHQFANGKVEARWEQIWSIVRTKSVKFYLIYRKNSANKLLFVELIKTIRFVIGFNLEPGIPAFCRVIVLLGIPASRLPPELGLPAFCRGIVLLHCVILLLLPYFFQILVAFLKIYL